MPTIINGTEESIEELLFARKLADVCNTTRLKSLKKLHNYLKLKSIGKGFSYSDMIKIWKGLYYCMYMSDKPLVQEDLAENISQLIHKVQTSEQKHLFFKAALDTYVREWDGIDKFRMDKFLMLLTRVLRQCLFYLSQKSWDIEEVNKICKILEDSVLTPFDQVNKYPLGLKIHFVEIILEELAKVGRENLEERVIIAFLIPFLKAFAVSTQQMYVDSIRNRVLEALIKLSEQGVKRQEDMAFNEVEIIQPKEQGILIDEEESFVMDPRAGGVDVHIPLLKIDYKKISDTLIEVGSIPEVRAKRRKEIYHLAKRFMLMSEGKYPLKVPTLKPEIWSKKKLVKDAIKRLESEENGNNLENKTKIPNDLLISKKRNKKMNPRKRKNKTLKNGRKVPKKVVETELKEKIKTKSNLAKKLNDLPSKLLDMSDSIKLKENSSHSKTGFEVMPMNSISKNSKSKEASNWQVKKLTNKSTEANKVIQGKRKRLKKMKRKESTSVPLKSNSNSETGSIQRSPESRKRKLEVEAVARKMKTPRREPNNSDSSVGSSATGGNPWDKPPADGEVEIFIPSKKFAKKIKKMEKERKLVIKKTPNVNTKGKTLKIDLRKNKEHDINDYHKVLKLSPGIPFTSQKKPLTSALKQSASPMSKTLKLNLKRNKNLDLGEYGNLVKMNPGTPVNSKKPLRRSVFKQPSSSKFEKKSCISISNLPR